MAVVIDDATRADFTRIRRMGEADATEDEILSPNGAAFRDASHPTVREDPTKVSLDEFAAAARLFSFTEPRPTRAGFASEPGLKTPKVTAQDAAGSRTGQMAGTSFRRITAASFSFGVVSLVGLMTVGMTMPAEALPHEHPITTTVAGDVLASGSDGIQAFVAPAQGPNMDIARSENYSVASLVDLAGTVGIANFSDSVFTNDQTCAIQWPYAVGVPMTYGFGMRDGRMHEGTDFVPGDGAQIQAIADGVVRIATDNGGAYGVTIVIDHVVDGQQVSSRYAHMQYDSRQVEVGDAVSVGEFIGRTGNTGRSFGAHLHFEILENGTTATDPLPWLRSYARC